jgi:SAM-dependent methyltransferase
MVFNPMAIDMDRLLREGERAECGACDSVRAAYDIASEAYASKFVDELDHKPLDRELLQQFAAIVGTERPVLDVGCGPGHTTAHLTSLGLRAIGVDLSPKMIEIASRTFPQSRFELGDFCSLRHESSSIAGILAFYCIVHLKPDQLVAAFTEMHRVLSDDGVLLLSFHVGAEVIHAEKFLDTDAVLDFTFFQTEHVETALKTAGFVSLDLHVRAPYVTEHPSQRCYVFAHKLNVERPQ